jgi:radical SAM superfamily enzyme YgiQ (UPF0313 family)
VTHYDYWKDQLMPTILEDSGADMLVYGMGEQPLRDILKLVKSGVPLNEVRGVNQIAYLDEKPVPDHEKWETVELASHDVCLNDKMKYAANFKIVEVESNKWQANRILQKVGDKTLVINPPFKTMDEEGNG